MNNISYHVMSYIILPKAVQQQPTGCNSSVPTCQGWSHWLGLSHQDQSEIKGIQVETYGNLRFLVTQVYQIKINFITTSLLLNC